MRYFLTITPGQGYDSGARPVPQEIMDAMGPYIDKLVASGTLISTGGLKSSSTSRRLAGQTGRVVATDGPFAEAKEVIGGYAVIEAPSLAAAEKIGADFVQLHIDNRMPDITVDVRQIDGGYNI